MSSLERTLNKSPGKSDSTLERTPEPENAFAPEDFEETYAAYIRYLRYEDGELRQGNLVQAGSPVPEDAVAVSTGVYLLTANQEDRIHWETPGARLGRGIPTSIQDECNADGRVAYSIVAESDAIEDGVDVATIFGWLSTFAEEWLGIDEYTFYYSGNRSIHLHTGEFVSADGMDDLRRLAEEFNDTNDADLDTGIYDQNSQFRLVGAEHRKTGLHKVPISEEADLDDCIRAAQAAPAQKQHPYELPSPSHHDEDTLASLDRHLPASPQARASHYHPGIEGISSLPPEIERQVLRGVHKACNPGSCNREQSGYARPFSPYKKTGTGKGRSVIVMEQSDGLRQDRRSRDIYVPARIEYAVGGGDGSFTRKDSRSLVSLSPPDYRKWEFEEGDTIVIIGGNSGKSRLLGVEGITARLVATALESQGREKALEVLSNRGHDVGSSGYKPSQYHEKTQATGETEAAKIKRGIEKGTRERSYTNILRAACRLLRIDGWDSAYGWCRDILGADFDPVETHEKLESIVETYGDYDHVTVPDPPEEGGR